MKRMPMRRGERAHGVFSDTADNVPPGKRTDRFDFQITVGTVELRLLGCVGTVLLLVDSPVLFHFLELFQIRHTRLFLLE